MSPARRARRPRGDDGQLVLLIIGFVLVTALLVTVVVNASRLFLMQRSLSGLTDGAAVAAAQAVDEAAFYTGGLDAGTVPLDDRAAAALVQDYLDAYFASTGNRERYPGLRVVDVAAAGGVATVTLRVLVPLPFVNTVSDRYDDGVGITAVASARLDVE